MKRIEFAWRRAGIDIAIKWEGCFFQVSHSARPRLRDDSLHCLTRHQNAVIRLENRPSDWAKLKLWIAPYEFSMIEAFIPNAALLKRFKRRLAISVILPRQP